MAPIIKKSGPGVAGKSGTASLVSKTQSGKSSGVMKIGNKQNNTSNLGGKSSLSSFSEKKSSYPSSSGKTSFTAPNSGKKEPNFSSSNNYKSSNKSSSPPNFGEKPIITSSIGATSSKSFKPSIDPFKTISDKSDSKLYMTPKNKSSSIKFGIIWLPTKKRNKMKDSVYNPYDNDRRDLFKERTPSMYNFMPGDTSDRQTFKKKEEETDLLSSDRNKLPPTTLATVSSEGITSDNAYNKVDLEEKQEFLKENKEESKDAGGDSYDTDKTSDYLENKDKLNKSPEAAWEKEKSTDKIL